MTLLRPLFEDPLQSPIYAPTAGKWGSDTPVPPLGFVFIVESGVYLTRNGAYLVKAG